MDYVLPIILIPSLFGAILGFFFPRKFLALIAAPLFPWLALVGFVLFDEFVLPYRGGGASFWPLAIMIHGTVVAIFGGFSFAIGTLLSKKLSHQRQPKA